MVMRQEVVGEDNPHVRQEHEEIKTQAVSQELQQQEPSSVPFTQAGGSDLTVSSPGMTGSSIVVIEDEVVELSSSENVEVTSLNNEKCSVDENSELDSNYENDLEKLNDEFLACTTFVNDFVKKYAEKPSDSLVEIMLRTMLNLFRIKLSIADASTQKRYQTVKTASEESYQALLSPAIKEWQLWERKATPLFEKVVVVLKQLGVPNGGKAFDQTVVLPSLSEIGCTYSVLEGKFGLMITSEEVSEGIRVSVSGIPDVKQGEKLPLFKLHLSGLSEVSSYKHYKDLGYEEDFAEKILSLYRSVLENYEHKWVVPIKPDPSTMWKRIDCPKSLIEFGKDDVAYETCEAPEGYHVIAGSQKGRSHWHQGSPRDDDFGLDYNASKGWNLLVVADGAGSKKYSRKGSEVVCNYLKDNLVDLITPEMEQHFRQFVQKQDIATEHTVKLDLYQLFIRYSNTAPGAIAAAKNELVALARQKECSPADFSTTLLCTLAKKFEEGWFFGSFMVGDGAMALYEPNEGIVLLGDPDEGEYSGQTRFITTEGVWNDAQALMNRITVISKPTFTALFLMTDGVSDPKFETEVQLHNIKKWDCFYGELFSQVIEQYPASERAAILARYLDFYTPGHHDDRTLAILYKEPQKDN